MAKGMVMKEKLTGDGIDVIAGRRIVKLRPTVIRRVKRQLNRRRRRVQRQELKDVQI